MVSAGFGLNGLIERYGVERRVHTAGDSKVRLDPFQPGEARGRRVAQGPPGAIARAVRRLGQATPGRELKATDDELFNGEVWTGAKAVELDLVDGVGTLRGVVAKRYPDAEIAVAEPRRPLLARLGLAGATTDWATSWWRGWRRWRSGALAVSGCEVTPRWPSGNRIDSDPTGSARCAAP